MKSKLMILSAAGFVALAGSAVRVVPVDRPGLVLPGKTLADVQTNADLAAFRRAWIDGRAPLTPPVPGWTSEKLADETLRLGSRFVR